MDDDDVLEKLVKMLSAFFTEGIAVEEDLSFSLTNDFLRNVQDVLYNKQLVVFSRWETFFDINSRTMLASTEVYLRYVIYACLRNNRVNLKAFEGFLGVFALILSSSLETRYRTEMNFCNLVPDVFMVIYENVLKKPFRKCGGFREFVKYINDPKYLKKKCIVRNISDSYDPNASVSEILRHLRKKVSRMESEDVDIPIDFDFIGAEKHELSSTFARKVLEITKIKLPPIPSDYGLNVSLSYLYPQTTVQIGNRPEFLEAVEKGIHPESTSELCPSLRSDSKTSDDTVVQTADNTRYENIIESVIRHNNSISSSHVKSKSPVQMEIDRNLEQMKSMLNFLIQVLDENDKE